MFLIIAPIAIAALIIGAPRLSKKAEASSTPLSIPSVILSVPAFGGLVYGLSKLSSHGLDGVTAAVLAIAVLSLVGFVMLQLKLQKKDHALLDMRPFTYRPFTLSLALMVLAMVALFGVIILLPMYLQNVRGLDTLATGLMLLPGGLLMGLMAPFVGRAYDRVGPRPLVIPGAVILAVVLFGYSRLLGADTPIPVIIGLHLTMSLSLSLIFTPAFTTALNPLPHSLHSHGSAVLSTLQQLGGAAGTALLVGVLASRIAAGAVAGTDPIAAQISGFSAGFTVGAVCAVGMVVIALFMSKAPAEERAQSAHAH
jgi:DHA2 family lincomycin resistance protein-like MFS transporter